jgi:hypothetical protein
MSEQGWESIRKRWGEAGEEDKKASAKLLGQVEKEDGWRKDRISKRKKNASRVKKNKAKRKAAAQAKRTRRLAWVNGKKKACVVCGESFNRCLEFHHVNPSKKAFEVSSRIRIYREDRFLELKKEIRKCVVLCANCHKKLHAGAIALINVKDVLCK